MTQPFFIYNTLDRKKEEFKPLNPPYVGMYVCGPTVYGDAHLGHARPAITFDVLFRYLKHQGYKVRYSTYCPPASSRTPRDTSSSRLNTSRRFWRPVTPT